MSRHIQNLFSTRLLSTRHLHALQRLPTTITAKHLCSPKASSSLLPRVGIMPRGAYDLTNPAAYKSSAAATAIQMHKAKVDMDQAKAAEEQAAAHVGKLIKSKKSRGIMDARKAVKEATDKAEKLIKHNPETDNDAAVRP